MERIIKIVDTGTERYTLNPQQIVLGRMYDNNSEKITINRPNAEKDSVCTMIITDVSGKVIDCVIITDKTYTITNTISAHQFVKIGFSFSRPDGYVKGTEIALGKFLPAAKPDGLVLVEPEQQKNINYLIAYGVTDSRLSGNALEFFNMNGDNVVSFDLSPFMQAQSDLGEKDETAETFVKGKKISNLENDSGFITKSVNGLENYYNKENTYSKEEVGEQVKAEVAKVNATQIRNKAPNLIIEATSANVQEAATKYIVDNYERQPQEYDGLYLTFTDHENQVVEYAFHNNAWVSAGFDKVDLSSYVDLATEQIIGGRKVFKDESSFNKQVEFNGNALLSDSKIITTDTTTDSVTKYGANSIEVERNNGSKKILNIPNKDGTLATEEDVNKKLAFKYARFENSGKDDVIVTDDIDSSVAMYHRNGTTQAGFVAQKNYAEQSTIDTTAEGTVTHTKVASGNGVSSVEAEDNQGNKSSIKVSTTDIEVNKRIKVKETDNGVAVDVSIKTDLENYVEKQSEVVDGNDKFYSQISNENGEFLWSISRNSDDPLHSLRANKNGVFIDDKKHPTKEIKRLSNVAISTIFNNISIDNIKVIKIRFRADTNFNGVSYDQSVNESGILMTNYSASNSALIATANETLVLYKSYNYESNYEFAVGNYKLSVSNGSMPKLSYYGIQYKTELNSAHWIIAESTTDFKVDAEIEIES